MSLVRINLLYMSICGGMLVPVVALLRKLLRGRLPGRVFTFLWCIVLIRLILPFSISSPVSVYPFTGQPGGSFGEAVNYLIEGVWPGEQENGDSGEDAAFEAVKMGAAGWLSGTGARDEADSELSGAEAYLRLTGASGQGELLRGITGAGRDADGGAISGAYDRNAQRTAEVLRMIGRGGTLVCGVIFLTMYLSCLRLFGSSVPVENPFVKRWVQKNRLRRKIVARQSDRIVSPLTYGIFRPVILLPVSLSGEDERKLAYILQHEMVHIRRFDGGLKPIMAAALCLHWFNPLVWVMYVLFNRDVELACDEEVLRIHGAEARKGYAMTLIGMEERKFTSLSLLSGFGKNAVEERVGEIMKYNKKKKGILAAAAAVLVFTTAFVFATSVRAGESAGGGMLSGEAGSYPEDIQGTDVMDPPGNNMDAGQSRTEADSGIGEIPPVQNGRGDAEALSGQPAQGNGAGTGEVPKLFPGMSYASGEEDNYELTYMVEGMEETEPAWLIYGQGYCLLIPKGKWKMSAPEEWVSEANSSVVFRVVHFSEEGSEYSGQSYSEIAEAYMELGYEPMYTEYQLYRETDGVVDVVEIRSNSDDVWGLNYTYPSEAEGGFGVRLRAMAQYFGIMPLSEEADLADQIGIDEQARAKETVMIVLELSLQKETEGLSSFLSSSFEGDLEILEYLKECSVEELSMRLHSSSNTILASVPVKTTESEDSADYLTIGLAKEDGEWKVLSMGLEK